MFSRLERMWRTPAALAVAALLLLAALPAAARATAPDTAPNTDRMPAEMAQFVPEGTMALLYAPSMQDLYLQVHELVEQTNPGFAPIVRSLGTDGLARLFIATRNKIRTDRPTAIVVAYDETQPDADLNLILLCYVQGAAAQNVRPADGPAMHVVVGPNDLVVASQQLVAPRTEPVPLTGALPAGTLSFAIDAGLLMNVWGDKIEGYLTDIGDNAAGEAGLAAPGVTNSSKRDLLQLLDGLQTLDGAVTLQDATVALELNGRGAHLNAAPGGTDLARLATMMPADLPFQFLVSDFLLDESLESLHESVQAMADAAPVDTRPALQRICKQWIALNGQITGGFSFALGAHADGFSVVETVVVDDVETALVDTAALLHACHDADVGVTVDGGYAEGGEAQRYRISIDPQRLAAATGAFDEEALSDPLVQQLLRGPTNLRIYVRDDIITIVTGNDAAITAAVNALALREGSPDPVVAGALQAQPESVQFYGGLELRALLRDLVAFMEGMDPRPAFIPIVADGPPIPMQLRISADKTSFSVAVRAAVGAATGLHQSVADQKDAHEEQVTRAEQPASGGGNKDSQ